MELIEAKKHLDKVIKAARIHFYKPIQIAEILYQHRIRQSINLNNVEEYRTPSRAWRDEISYKFTGNTSSSSSVYQDNLFNENAVPPRALVALGKENLEKEGIIESYIYRKFAEKHYELNSALSYVLESTREAFNLETFFNLFRESSGLRRSMDKVYEIVVYALFKLLVENLNIKITVGYDNNKIELLKEFEDFTQKVISIDSKISTLNIPARIFRVGVANAADRGLDMYANFGPAIQVKHLSLSEHLAENIVSSVSADRIIIVCKDSEERVILSLVNQIGWKSRIQSIITDRELIKWYDRALKGKYKDLLGDELLDIISKEIPKEFPSTGDEHFNNFIKARKYEDKIDHFWK